MKKELSSAEIKGIELDTLDFFVQVCEENHINYFLSFGSMLGAVRHKGFIPWDDDIDVGMKRTDYDRFQRIFQDNDKYSLKSIQSSKEWLYPFMKLCNLQTEVYEPGIIQDKTNLGIDIFPVDMWPDDLNEALKIKKTLVFFKKLQSIAVSNGSSSETVKTKVMRVISKIVGYKYFVSKIDSISRKYNNQNSKYAGFLVCSREEYEILSSDIFDKIIKADFENRKYNILKDYDLFLKSVYGDYNRIPPESERQNGHGFKAYLIG